ncbi:MAG: hypothetical protein CMJ25_21420 [Phycisphaerae bacterium]|nr:hypothetical protein [Phycisphaerae bacterium]|tara:strand:+ start:1186 stop:1614 length:429 start_codon:yes stop_codon:yes gene_type:complete
MQFESNLAMKGRLTITINDEVVQEVDNLVVTTGKGYVASRMKDATTTAMSHMAIGTGSTAAAVGDTALGGESARVALTSTAVSGADVTYVATFGAGTGTAAITEAAVLNASSAGTMLCRTVFAVVNKGQSDSMVVTWTVTAS